jgi:hypothetical protein
VTATTEPITATNVVTLGALGAAEDSRARDARLGVLAPVVVAGITLSALDGGLYDYSRWGLLAAAMLAVLAGLLIAGRVGRFGDLTAPLVALAALAALAAASLWWADSPDRAWTESNRLVLYTAVFAACAVALRTTRDIRRSLAIIGTVIAAAALWTGVALLRGDPGAFLDHRLDMPIGYINGTAGLFLIGLWPAVSLAERAVNPLVAGASMAFAVLEANLLVLTQSRAIVPAVLLSTCVLVGLFPGRIRRVWSLLFIGAGVAAASPWTLAIYADRIPAQPRPVTHALAQGAAIASLLAAAGVAAVWAATTLLLRRRAISAPAQRIGAIATVVVVLGAIAGGAVASGDPLARVQGQWRAFTTLNATETSSTRFTGAGGFRYDLWRVAVDDFRHAPVLGVGAGSYGLSYYQKRAQQESIRQPHSLPLQVLAELGLLGGVLALIVVAGVAATIVRHRRRDVLVGVAGAGMACSWAVQASLDWLYNLPGITCIAIVGVVAASGGRPFVAFAGTRTRRLVLISSAVLVAVAAASFGRQYSASVYAQGARDALADSPSRALERSATSLQLNPYAVETYYTRAAAYARLDDYAHARNLLMRAAAREPLNFVPWALMGDLAARRGEIAQARSAYRRAEMLNPRDPQLRELATDPGQALR